MNSIAIIPARGGSKRIPQKNIRELGGHPIIKYSIEAALKANCFDLVMVSTDDVAIATVAKHLGAEVPFYRSVEASSDYATTAEVIKEVLENYLAQGIEFQYCCCLYPTACFVTSDKLLSAYELLCQTGADTVVPVAPFLQSIYRSLSIDKGKLKMNWPQYMSTRSQDLPPAYHDAGQFYFLNVIPFLRSGRIFGESCLPIEVSSMEVQDIDSEEDWQLAELKFQVFQKTRTK